MAAISADNIGEYTHSEAPAPETTEEVQDEQPNETNVEGNQENEVSDTSENSEDTGVDNVQESSTEGDENANPWDITKYQDENGLVAGKYKNLDAMMKSMEHAEAKITELQAEKQSNNAKDKNAIKAQEAQAAINNVEAAAVEKYLQTGTMSAELIAEIEAGGGDATRVELNGIKTSQYVGKMHDIVGGKENFDQMITDMSEGRSEAEKAAWLRSVSDPSMSEYAVKGLHAEWMQKTGRREAPQRLRGQTPAVGTTKPYASQAEMLAAAGKARSNPAVRAEYESRKRVTPDSVVFGR